MSLSFLLPTNSNNEIGTDDNFMRNTERMNKTESRDSYSMITGLYPVTVVGGETLRDRSIEVKKIYIIM